MAFGKKQKKPEASKTDCKKPSDLDALRRQLKLSESTLERTVTELQGSASQLEALRRENEKYQLLLNLHEKAIRQYGQVLGAIAGHLALTSVGESLQARFLKNRKIVDETQAQLAQLYRRTEEENIILKRVAIERIANLLSQGVREFARAPIGIYDSSGNLIFQTDKFERFATKMSNFYPTKTIPVLREELEREDSLTRTYDGVPVTYASYKTPFGENYTIISIDSIPRRNAERNAENIKAEARADFGRKTLNDALAGLFSRLATQTNP